ncbi:EamA family transporter, partial [Basilea psittacipulmonis]
MLYLLIAAFFWGTSFIAGKFAYTMADPALVVLFRLIIAGSIMLPISLRYWQ